MLEPLRAHGGPKMAQGPKIDSKLVFVNFFDGFAVPSVVFCVVISFPLGQLTVISFVVKDKRKTRRDKPGQEKTRRGETIGYKRT